MISDLEKKILISLTENARKSFRSVAKEVGTSTTAVYNNVKKMEQSGLLKGYIPDVDEVMLGFDLVAIMALRITHGKLRNVYKALKDLPPVKLIFDITGEWDCILICYFKERKELDNFLKTKLAVPHIERVVTHVVLNVIKDEKRPLLD
jgi:DNA-binding Lrp family transcriptional regulator